MLSTESVKNLTGKAGPFQGGCQIQESQRVHPVAGVIKVSDRRLNKEDLHENLFYIRNRQSAINVLPVLMNVLPVLMMEK